MPRKLIGIGGGSYQNYIGLQERKWKTYVKKNSFVLPRLHCMMENTALKLPLTNAYLSLALTNLQLPSGPFWGQK